MHTHHHPPHPGETGVTGRGHDVCPAAALSARNAGCFLGSGEGNWGAGRRGAAQPLPSRPRVRASSDAQTRGVKPRPAPLSRPARTHVRTWARLNDMPLQQEQQTEYGVQRHLRGFKSLGRRRRLVALCVPIRCRRSVAVATRNGRPRALDRGRDYCRGGGGGGGAGGGTTRWRAPRSRFAALPPRGGRRARGGGGDPSCGRAAGDRPTTRPAAGCRPAGRRPSGPGEGRARQRPAAPVSAAPAPDRLPRSQPEVDPERAVGAGSSPATLRCTSQRTFEPEKSRCTYSLAEKRVYFLTRYIQNRGLPPDVPYIAAVRFTSLFHLRKCFVATVCTEIG